MNIPSGYQVLDLRGELFATGALTKTIPGAFAAVAGANGKLLIVANLNVNNELMANMTGWYQIETDSITISTEAGYGIAITDEDSVTVTVPAAG